MTEMELARMRERLQAMRAVRQQDLRRLLAEAIRRKEWALANSIQDDLEAT